MNVKEIVKEILSKNEIKHIVFVGCGASMSDLYPAKYFLEQNACNLKIGYYTASEFNHATPNYLGQNTLVVSASLGGSTPETVEANYVAKQRGAHIISLTRSENSALTKDADYTILHRFAESYSAKLEKTGYALRIAVEVLEQTEGYAHYEDMMEGFEKIFDLCDQAAGSAKKAAREFAQNYKDDSVIYVMSSGASAYVAYSTSVCLMMEMQWINSGSFHCGEFFHGPFEIVDKDVPFILFMNDGKTRNIDSRALEFLNRFDAKVSVVDALDYGLSSHIKKSVVDYFNPFVITAVFRVYAEQISIVREHPLTKRRYMWKIEY